jgi:competence ComEA-like helix-hairpin-helix protein
MPALTDAERRGARWLAVLLLVGTLHDLIRAQWPAWTPEVPEVVAGPPVPGPADSLPPPAPVRPAPVNLNRATPAELDALPGIGPVLARRIVDRRERAGRFHDVDELLAVPGIGPRLLERLRPLLTVAP